MQKIPPQIHHVPVVEVGEISPPQARLWAGQQVAPHAPLYNTPFSFRIRAPLETERFRAAFDQVVEDCDSLRTVFIEGDHGPRRVVLSGATRSLELIDLSGEADPESQAQVFINEQAARPFSLSEVLYYSVLIKLGDSDHIWFLNQHHLITDAWATSLVYRHLQNCYDCLGQNRRADPPPSFADYLNGAVGTGDRSDPDSTAWWADRGEQFEKPPCLYGLRHGSESTESRRLSVPLGEVRSRRLRKVVEEAGVRAFTSDLALYQVFATLAFAFLYRVSGERGLLLGTPASHRGTPAARETPGLFIELFPLRTDLEDGETFEQLLQKTQQEIGGLIRRAGPGQSEGTGRGYNVVLNYITAKFPPFESKVPEVEWLHPGHCDSHHHLRIQVHDFEGCGQFSLLFDLNSEVFPEGMHSWVAHHFISILDAFLDDRTQAIDAVEIVHPEERRILLEEFRVPGVSIADRSLVEAFERMVRAQPEAAAISAPDGALDFGELGARVSAVSGGLIAAGVRTGDVVGLRATREIGTVVGLLAILKAGGAYLPLDPDHPASRNAMILEDAGVGVVVSSCPLDGWEGDTVDPRAPARSVGSEAASKPLETGDLAYVLYTSGSTGKPKGVQVEHGNVLTLVAGLHERVYKALPARMRVAQVAPFVFDASVQQLFAALLLGHELVLVPDEVRVDGDALLHFLHAEEIDLTDGTPAHLSLLASSSDRQVANARALHFVIGGEELRTRVVREFFERFPEGDPLITNVYGPTECCVDSTSLTISRTNFETGESSIPIGTPMPAEQAYVLQSRSLQPIGAPGELCLGGGGVSRGYLGREGGGATAFQEDPFVPGGRFYRTGDLARYREGGLIEFLGRRDAQVKVRGYRIELGEIEAALRAFDEPVQLPIEAASLRRGVRRCVRCVLSENYPGVDLDDQGVCARCRDYERFRGAADDYFRPFKELESLLDAVRGESPGTHDCLLLYSGGKDSSYVLHRLVEMGLNVLAYTFDNGFISPAAFKNIERQTSRLGVECIVSKTPRMDAIFVESLEQDQTVCTGCFKALTTISTRLAADRGIKVVLTGLSRGQVFETKIEDLFSSGTTAVNEVEEKLQTFRRIYHSQEDRMSRLLDVSVRDVALEKFHFIDWFRYDATPTAEVRKYLGERDAFWTKPTDTGFCSSNCMMNDIGICVHSRERGYHNYEAPLSWDVRLGIAERRDALAEVESPIDLVRVNRVLGKIGYLSKKIDEVVVTVRAGANGDPILCAYFTSAHELDSGELREHLAARLPSYMVPQQLVQVPSIPLTRNGKVDYRALATHELAGPSAEGEERGPLSPTEEQLVAIWSEVLGIEAVGIHDSFVSLGGTSLSLIQMRIRLQEEFGVEIPLESLFAHPTVAELAGEVESAESGGWKDRG